MNETNLRARFIGSLFKLHKESLLIAVIASTFSMSTPARADEAWYPSKYGAGDTIGAANNMSPELVRSAIKLVTEGKVYALAIDTGPQTPRPAPARDLKVEVVSKIAPGSPAAYANRITGFASKINGWMSIGTNIDGLASSGIDFRHYNGIPANEIYGIDGVKKLSLHAVPPIVTRGVMLDMAGYFGVDIIKNDTVFNKVEIEGAANRQGIEIQKGDVVLFHTGRLHLVQEHTDRFMAAWPGLGKEGARYLAGLGIVAVGADTWAPEIHPGEDKSEHAPVHQILQAQHGIYIMELINTNELSVDNVYEFLFVLGIPRIVGSVDAIINPVAIR
jgi:kynurenine formamidase